MPIDKETGTLTAQEQISELIQTDSFDNLKYEEKRERIEGLLDSLHKEALILEPAEYDDNQQLYTFTFEDNVLGGISLKEQDESLNGNLTEQSETLAGTLGGESETNILVFNGFEDKPFRRDYYENLEKEWDALGFNTLVDTDITVADMAEITEAEVIVFSMHGSTYKDSPVLCLNERVTDKTDTQYQKHLRNDQTVAKVFCSDDAFHYWVFPSFFEYNYEEKAFDGKIVYSESCDFYGSDNNLGGLDTSFSDVFLLKSAEVVIGYYNSVGAEYSRNVMKHAIDSMFSGATAENALSEAILHYGADDQWEDVAKGKYKAYPVLQGDKSAILNLKADNTHSIPSSLKQASWASSENMEYCSSVTFYENMQCELNMNLGYTMQNVSGTYTVTVCENEKRLIRCDYTGAVWGDGLVREIEYFYLVEETENVWTYYGENIGIVLCGETFAGEGLHIQPLSINTNVPTITPMAGIYHEENEPLNELTVLEVYGNDAFRFSVDWYRWIGFGETEAKIYGNIAVFSNKEEFTGQETKGVIELSEDGSLTIHLFETLLMENGSYFTYPTWNSFEEAEQAYYNAMAQILLMNDDQRGWVLPLYDEYPEYNAVGRTYLRFYENGTVDCWISEEIGGDVIYECHSGAYWVDKNTLYIDGNPYEFFGETTGITYMQLSALGSYALDFSGYYWCEQNEIYAFLYGNLG